MRSTKSHSSFKFIWILKVADLTCRTFERKVVKKKKKRTTGIPTFFVFVSSMRTCLKV